MTPITFSIEAEHDLDEHELAWALEQASSEAVRALLSVTTANGHYFRSADPVTPAATADANTPGSEEE
jgi:hypothetical protein